MKNIWCTKIIANSDPEKFGKEFGKTIREFQHDGCEVEVHYSYSNDIYTALILGRK
jgi:hypothetical protein